MIHYNFVIRTYFTPQKLTKFSPNHSHSVPTVRLAHFHVMWECTAVYTLWRSVSSAPSTIVGKNVTSSNAFLFSKSVPFHIISWWMTILVFEVCIHHWMWLVSLELPPPPLSVIAARPLSLVISITLSCLQRYGDHEWEDCAVADTQLLRYYFILHVSSALCPDEDRLEMLTCRG